MERTLPESKQIVCWKISWTSNIEFLLRYLLRSKQPWISKVLIFSLFYLQQKEQIAKQLNKQKEKEVTDAEFQFQSSIRKKKLRFSRIDAITNFLGIFCWTATLYTSCIDLFYCSVKWRTTVFKWEKQFVRWWSPNWNIRLTDKLPKCSYDKA